MHCGSAQMHGSSGIRDPSNAALGPCFYFKKGLVPL